MRNIEDRCKEPMEKKYDDPIPEFDMIMNHEHKIERSDESIFLPCPFCGATKDIFVESYECELGKRWRVVCATCMAAVDKGYTPHKNWAIEAWNRRA